MDILSSLLVNISRLVEKIIVHRSEKSEVYQVCLIAYLVWHNILLYDVCHSTASHEASGTSNMKFLMNGCLLLATSDGSTIEIIEEIGEDNMVT